MSMRNLLVTIHKHILELFKYTLLLVEIVLCHALAAVL